MRRSAVAACFVSMLLVGSGVAVAEEQDAAPPTDDAAIDDARGFERFDSSDLGNVAEYAPTDPNQVVDATVLLGGNSVVAQQAEAEETQTAFNESVAEQNVETLQNALIPGLEAAGATVTGRMDRIVNGVRVQIRAGDLAALAAAPGVVKVQPSKTYTLDNGNANVYTQTAQTWQDLGVTGSGMRIAIIDDGIDYYHADFGGSGDPAEYAADDRLTIEPGTFPTTRVVAGYDFVGDAYDANADEEGETTIPAPDPDPLACGDHGTHVAGTAAGNGVLADGTAFAGPYNAATMDDNEFLVPPGSAPQADILAYKVFGCDGSVDDAIIIDAIDQAVADGAQVINMSLGSAFGTEDSIEADAIRNATRAGVLVVASAGNEGANAYITGAPASSDEALSVAANDVSFPTLVEVLATGSVTDTLGNSNLFEFNGATITGEMVDVGLGCDAADYANVAGKIALSTRGVCARVDRATLGDAAGAVAVLMINTAPGLPPVEGAIAGVDIPFLGVNGEDGAAFRAAAVPGNSVTLGEGAAIPNPAYTALASFTSGGPRNGDSAIKPDVTAPGGALISALVGSGTEGQRLSGTSMSAPHTAGIALLVRQAHPNWRPLQVKAAIQSTADPSAIVDYNARRSGTGAVNALRAVSTVGFITTGNGRNAVSFGFRQATSDITVHRTFTIHNTSRTSLTYDLAAEFSGDALGAEVTFFPNTVRVDGRSTRTVTVWLRMSRDAVAALPNAADVPAGAVVSVQGNIVATPRSSGPGVYPLRAAFNVVPSGTSYAWVQQRERNATTLTVKNYGSHAAVVDQYQWVITDPRNDAGDPSFVDVIDVGIQSFPITGDQLMVFNVNTARSRSTHAIDFIELLINSTGDAAPDYRIWVVDEGLLTAGSPSGTLTAVTLDADFNVIDQWGVVAPMNGSTVQFAATAGAMGITGLFEVSVNGSSIVADGDPDSTASGFYDPFAPAVSVGAFEPLAAFSKVTIPGTVDAAQVAIQQPLGWLIATLDDAGGIREGDRVPLRQGR